MGLLISNMVTSPYLRDRGANVGVSKSGAIRNPDLTDFMQNCRNAVGVVENDSVPGTLIRTLVDLYVVGKVPFDRLVKIYDKHKTNQAAADSEAGVTLDPIVHMQSHA
ncbi:hypothetical protein OO012_05300 [Rhodobacteraceae bacterium KMM 6894]|nr:hypothetical protein [Rhodobacteraceae bacterium KMM 6894]